MTNVSGKKATSAETFCFDQDTFDSYGFSFSEDYWERRKYENDVSFENIMCGFLFNALTWEKRNKLLFCLIFALHTLSLMPSRPISLQSHPLDGIHIWNMTQKKSPCL